MTISTDKIVILDGKEYTYQKFMEMVNSKLLYMSENVQRDLPRGKHNKLVTATVLNRYNRGKVIECIIFDYDVAFENARYNLAVLNKDRNYGYTEASRILSLFKNKDINMMDSVRDIEVDRYNQYVDDYNQFVYHADRYYLDELSPKKEKINKRMPAHMIQTIIMMNDTRFR